MTHKTLECGPAPAIKIEIHGDARIEGWDKNEIHAESDNGQIELLQDGEAISLTCNNDCEVTLPRGAAVAVMAVRGDARIRDITGSLALGAVGGDCSIKRVAMLDIQNVGGDAELVCERLGAVALNVGGDARLVVKSGPIQPFSIKAGGDIDCKLPLGINAQVSLTDGAGKRTFVAGDGGAAVSLVCGGDARLAGAGDPRETRGPNFNFDFGKNFGPDFGRDFGKQISEQLEAKFRHQAEKMAQKASRQAERAASRAEAHAERMARKAEHRTWHRFGFGGAFGDETAAAPSATPQPSEGPSDEERIAILRMLAEKKITAEQADQLITALER